MNIPDFVHGPLAWRSRHGGGRGQALARACGVKRRIALPKILDCTAGLGRDAFLLAALGCEVLSLERNCEVHAALVQALARAQEDGATRDVIGNRLQFVLGDALELLPDLVSQIRPDVLYLDPMHPPRGKSALTRLPLRELRSLVGEDADSPELLALACQQEVARVVVKRPAGAEPLWGKPTAQIPGRTTQFDLYFSG